MRRDMIDLLLALPLSFKPIMIMATHAPDDARAFATQLLLVTDGKAARPMPITELEHPVPGSTLSNYLGTRPT
jgi:ABC-type thiamine transport system ATPase subunit